MYMGGEGARAQGRAERQGESAAVVILPGRNRKCIGAGGTRWGSGAGVEAAGMIDRTLMASWMAMMAVT